MERKLSAVFSANVQGYSRLMGDDEEATIQTLKTYREVITSLIEQHHGRVVDSPGDNLLAEFASAVDAVKSAVAIQQELKTRNAELDNHRKMEFRIGLNVGDVIADEGRLYGDGVNIAARLEGLADPGGICLSGTVYDQIANKLACSYEFQGEQTLKNIAQPVRVYRVSPEGEKVAIPLSFEPQTALPFPDKPSIAVLPFTNMSADPEQEYFSDGITDDIITALSKIAGLFVIARNSTFTYKGRAVDVGTVGRKLGAQYMLEGSVRKSGNRLRINAQLIETTPGGHLWAEQYDRELKEVFALQDEITQKIVFALKVKITKEEQEQLRRYPTDNLEAYDCFLRGMHHYVHYTQERFAQAQPLFEQAIELDPGYAAAYAMLSASYRLTFAYQWSRDAQLLKHAFELAQKAVALDDSLPLAHMALGPSYLWHTRELERAIAEGEKAISLNPNYADAYVLLADILNLAGRPQDAIGLVQKAMRLNPHYPPLYLHLLGMAYSGARQYEEAIAAHKKGLSFYPDALIAHLSLADIYSALGREEEARAAAAEVLRISPNFSLEILKQTLPVKNEGRVERYIAALRKAGLK